jgi:hypothetical protein
MRGHLLPNFAVRQQVVRTSREIALEAVVRRTAVKLGFETLNVGEECVNKLGLDRIFDDGEAVVNELLMVVSKIDGHDINLVLIVDRTPPTLQPARGCPPDAPFWVRSLLTLLGATRCDDSESMSQQWILDGRNLAITVTNGALVQQGCRASRRTQRRHRSHLDTSGCRINLRRR